MKSTRVKVLKYFILNAHFLLDSCIHLNNNFTWWRLNVWISAGCVSAWCCCCIFVIISEVLPPSSGRTEKHNMTWWPSSRRLLHIKLLYRCFCRSQLSPGLLQVELAWFLVVSMIHSSVMLVGGFVLHRDRGDLFMMCMLTWIEQDGASVWGGPSAAPTIVCVSVTQTVNALLVYDRQTLLDLRTSAKNLVNFDSYEQTLPPSLSDSPSYLCRTPAPPLLRKRHRHRGDVVAVSDGNGSSFYWTESLESVQ